MFEDDLDDFSDVSLITAMLIGTSKDMTIGHATRIQKMAFLVDKIMAQPELDREFDFGADKFGPMSENVESSVEVLISWGYAESTGARGKGAVLTGDGVDLVEAAAVEYPGVFELCRRLNEDLGDLSTDEIVKIVYRLYPDHTVNSLIRDELVRTDRVDSFQVDPSVEGEYEILTENRVPLSVSVRGGVITLGMVDSDA